MTRPSRNARERAFEAYAANLSLYHPRVQQRFLCPICRDLHGPETLETPDPEVTVAHIVPEAAGGRAWTLTCKRCNSAMGSRYDSHLVEEHRFAQWRRGERPLPARLRSSEAEIGVEINRSDGGWTFREIAKQTDPEQSVAFFKNAQNWHDFRFTATMRQFDTKPRRMALLHSAFLTMFSAFGYEYALSPEAERIRRVLHGEVDPDELRAAFILVDPETAQEPIARPSVLLLTEPSEFRCFAVLFSDPHDWHAVRVVALPGFGQSGQACYEGLLSRGGKVGPIGAKIIERVERLALKRLADPKLKWRAHRLWDDAAES